MKRISAVLALTALSCQPAQAATCTFSVTNVFFYPDGGVGATLTSGSVTKSYFFCNSATSVTVNDGYASRTITPAVCQAFTASFLTAFTSGRPFVSYWKDPVNCDAALPPSGTLPNPYPMSFSVGN